jgi:N-acetylglucosamine kinase-like BadF-type ATPase
MTARFFLGVDGGGTKTRFALMVEGSLVAEAQLGTTYHPDVGIDGVRDVLAAGVQQICESAGILPAQITYTFIGLPGHGEDSSITPVLDRLPRAILGHDRYTVGNDMVCGWAGSLACEDGINIVAGTGSIGYAQRRGVAARAGGWGEHFSDEGSAYWIAMQGLNTFSRMSDGRLPHGPLHTHIYEALKLQDDLDLCAQVYGPNALSRGQLAQFSLLVSKAAEQGDAAALDIFQRAGAELAAIADALRRRTGFAAGERVPLSYSGGAFSAGELLLAPFRKALATHCPDFDLVRPLHEPHYGAALYASRLGHENRRTAATPAT